MLNPPPHVRQLRVAIAHDRAICDVFTENFNDPERQFDIFATPQGTKAFLQSMAGHSGLASST